MGSTSARCARVRPIIVSLTAIAFVIVVLVYFGSYGLPRFRQDAFSHLRPPPSPSPDDPEPEANPDDVINNWEYDHRRDHKAYGLGAEQCLRAFPLLNEEIDRAVDWKRKDGNVTLNHIKEAAFQSGAIRALIRKNELYIISAREVGKGEMRLRSLATLSSLYRAITSYQGKLPDVEFTLVIADPTQEDALGDSTAWAHSRLWDQPDRFIMPGSSFWSSPSAGLRSYPELRAILRDDEDYLDDKVPKLVWRGVESDTKSYAVTNLLKESKDQNWSDVRTLDWKDEKNANENSLLAEDYCLYMFAAATEGEQSIARLEYLLNCNNVVLAPELRHVKHFHHLLAPSGENQNYVKLKSDFSDLKQTMTNMLRPDVQEDRGRLIADNAKRMFRERYLTPAAEACYWRALIRGWASVQGFEPQLWVETEEDDWHIGSGGSRIQRRPRGVPFESYLLMEDFHWEFPIEDRQICVG